MVRRFAIVFIGVFWSFAAAAQTPLSAIDWLTDSLSNPPETTPPPSAAPIIPEPIQEVFITEGLSSTSPDSVGLLSPTVTGFAANLWGGAATRDIAQTIRSFPQGGYPEAQNVFRRILLAQANPPFDVTAQGQVLQARMAKLYEMGALDAAEAIYLQIQSFTPALFEQSFRVAILTDRTADICELLARQPALSNDLSTRTYCLARSGDWNAAAMTVSLAASIGAIGPAREEMLIRYLDPELFEGESDPDPPEPLLTMDFVLREAVLMPRPNGLLPLPYLYRDIGLRSPLRARIEASERLVRAGSLPGSLLFNAYRTGTPAASGGVWERAAAIQQLDAALEKGEDTLIADAIAFAASEMSKVGLTVPFAEEYAERLSALKYSDAYFETAGTIWDLLHLADIAAYGWNENAVASERQLIAHEIVARESLEDFTSDDLVVRAVIEGLSQDPPTSLPARDLLKMLEGGNQGLAILGALRQIVEGADADPEHFRIGLFVLRAAGQESAARRIAVQILLLPDEAV